MSDTVHSEQSPQESSNHWVQSGLAPKKPERDVVEIRVFWKTTLLQVIEWPEGREFFIGDGSREPVAFVLPGAGDRTLLVGTESGRPVVFVPAGATARRRVHGGSRDALRDTRRGETTETVLPRSATALAERLVLDGHTSVDLEIENLRFAVRLGEAESPCPRALIATADKRPLAFFGLAALFTGALVSSLAFFMPPLGLTDEDAMDKDQLYLMTQYLDAAAEREHEREKETAATSGATSGVDAPAEPARGDPGKIGRRDTTAQNRRASGTAAGPELRAATSRAEMIKEAQTFGLIGLLSSGMAGAAHAAFDDAGMGPIAAAGGFFGTEIGDVGGSNGLALGGNDEGGGGYRGDHVGLGSIGTCHGQECLGNKGWLVGSGRTGGPGHLAVAPVLHMGKTVIDRGSIPAEIIQRVVRQSFGLFRGCYEAGLRVNPTLEGRVTARFVIARDGSVATVQSGGADLPDPGVVSCVLRAYRSLSFPAPKDGIVTVTYPLTFSPAA